MRRTTLRHVALLVALLAGSTASSPAVAAGATDEACFDAPFVGLAERRTDVILLEGAELTTLVSNQGMVCPGGVSTTIRRSDGVSLTVELPTRFEGPGYFGYYGSMTVPVGGPLGTWTFTRITVGSETRTVSRTFRVERASVVAIDPVAPVTAPAEQTVHGVARTWNGFGTVVPRAAGTSVEVRTKAGTRIGVATTDAAGRFTIRTRLVHDNLVRGYVAADPARHIAAGASDLTPVVARAALSSFVAPATGVVNRWWRMDGRSAPGSLRTMLWVWNGSFWTSQSFGPAAADGTFTRWWKPTSTGTHRLRLELSGPFNSNLPIERQVSVAVRSLQTVPTYLDGRTGSTTGSIVRRSTQMSTFGHLRVRHGNGVVGPFVRQVVSIQARPVGAGAWRQVGTATTTSSGYFHARWLMPYTDDSEVRIAYTSPYETIRSTVLDQGVVDVR